MTGISITDFYNKNYKKLKSYLMGAIPNICIEIEDACVDSFMQAIDKIETFDAKKAHLNTWFYTIAKRMVLYNIGKKKSMVSIENDDEPGVAIKTMLAHENDVDKHRTELNIILAERAKQLIPKLHPKYVEVLTLRELRKYSYEEIQEKLELNMNTIKSRIRNGRIKLVELLEKERNKIEEDYYERNFDFSCYA